MIGVSNAAFKRWNSAALEHEIFREFIEKERNTILKEYQFNLHPNENVEVAIMLTLRPLAGGEPVRQPHVVPIGENMYRPMLDGFREGDDARDVLREAIEWWEEELSAIEAALAPK